MVGLTDTRRAAALLITSLIARLPLAMFSISLLVHVHRLTGLFAVAGAASGVRDRSWPDLTAARPAGRPPWASTRADRLRHSLRNPARRGHPAAGKLPRPAPGRHLRHDRDREPAAGGVCASAATGDRQRSQCAQHRLHAGDYRARAHLHRRTAARARRRHQPLDPRVTARRRDHPARRHRRVRSTASLTSLARTLHTIGDTGPLLGIWGVGSPLGGIIATRTRARAHGVGP